LEVDGSRHVAPEIEYFRSTLAIGAALWRRKFSIVKKTPYEVSAFRAFKRRLCHERLDARDSHDIARNANKLVNDTGLEIAESETRMEAGKPHEDRVVPGRRGNLRRLKYRLSVTNQGQAQVRQHTLWSVTESGTEIPDEHRHRAAELVEVEEDGSNCAKINDGGDERAAAPRVTEPLCEKMNYAQISFCRFASL
jgi:hypothetical protein